MPKSVFTDAYRIIIEDLVAARRAKKVSQAELAARLDKVKSFVAKVERRGRRLDVLEFCAVSRALGYDESELLARIAARLPREIEI